MKKISVLSLLLSVVMVAMAQNKVVNITAGLLEDVLAGDYSFTALTVHGEMDVRDFACINENAAHIVSIDLSGATIAQYDSRDQQFFGYHTHFEANAIPPSAFFGFVSLESIVLPHGVTVIGDGAFAGCEKLKTIQGGEEVVLIGDYAFSGCEKLSSYAFPTTMKRIGDYAFEMCVELQSIDLSQCPSLSYIGKRAFAQNKSLLSIKFPESVRTIGDAAFVGCLALTSVNMPQVEICGEGLFVACKALQNADFSNSMIEEMPAWTFSGCNLMTDINLPNSVRSIGEGAFYYCTSLPTVVLPAGLEYLDAFAFAGCSSLQEVTFIPEGMEMIGRYAFYQNTGVQSVDLPSSVSYIGDHAFDGCVNATTFDTPREMPAELGEMVFANMDVENKTLCVSAESVVIYQSTAQWQDFGKIEGISGVENVEVRNDVRATFEQYNLVVKSEQAMRDVRLYDVSGILLARATNNACEVVIDTQGFVSNVYLLHVTTADGRSAVTKVARVIR